mgnify:CR=1 FL=1|tara:strand:+ start:1788 stop:2039 length:252 start_codon:yes stop_codon:yes gene_type:complete
MFACPLCREEWCFVSKLCPDCDKVRHLYAMYDKRIIMDILEKTLIVQRFKDNKDYYYSVDGKWKKKEVGDESYEKPITRSKDK